MLAFCASTVGVPVAQDSSTLDSAVALAKMPKDDGCNQNTEYYMTASGGEGLQCSQNWLARSTTRTTVAFRHEMQ